MTLNEVIISLIDKNKGYMTPEEYEAKMKKVKEAK